MEKLPGRNSATLGAYCPNSAGATWNQSGCFVSMEVPLFSWEVGDAAGTRVPHLRCFLPRTPSPNRGSSFTSSVLRRLELEAQEVLIGKKCLLVRKTVAGLLEFADHPATAHLVLRRRADGERFLHFQATVDAPDARLNQNYTELVMVENFFEELRRLAPADLQ